MASQFFGLNRGQDTTSFNITTGAATGSTDVELRVDTGKGLTRKDVRVLTEQILNFIESGLNTAKIPPL